MTPAHARHRARRGARRRLVTVLALCGLGVVAGVVLSVLGSGGDGRAAAGALLSCNDDWTNASGGLWSDASNWSSGVPGTSSVVCIGSTTPGTYTVDLASPVQVSGLDMGDSTSGFQTLAVESGASLTVTSASFGVANDIGGSIANSGTVTVNSGVTFNQNTGTTSGTPMDISGTLDFSGGGNSAFDIAAGATVSPDLPGPGQKIVLLSGAGISGGGRTNTGDIEVSGTGASIGVGPLSASLTNDGTIQVDNGGSLTISGNGSVINNAGPGGLVVDGSLTMQSPLTNNGSVSTGSAGSLSTDSAVSNGTGGSITNDGTFTVTNTTFTEGAGTTFNDPIQLEGSLLDSTATSGASSFEFSACPYSCSTPAVSGALDASQSVQIDANVAVGFDAVHTGATVTLAGSGATMVTGPLGNVTTNTGTIIVDPGASAAITETGAGNFDNQGNVDIGDGAVLTDTAGTFTNDTGGTIASSGSGSLVDSGEKLTETAGTTSGNPVVIESDGNLDLNGTGDSSFEFASGTGTLSGGTVASGQAVTLDPGAAVDTGTLVNDGLIDSDATGPSVTITGSITNNGSLVTASGAPTVVSGNFTQSSSGTYTDDIADPATYGTLLVTGAVSLSGNLTAVTSGFTPTTGQSFAIITGASRTGQFSTYGFGGEPYTTVYSATAVNLEVASALSVTTTSLPSGVVGTAYTTTTLEATGGTPSYTWSVTTGSLPAGLALSSSSGVLTGTPTGTPGTTTFTVTVTDAGVPTQSATQSLSIDVTGTITQGPPTSDTTTTTASATYTSQLTTTGGIGTVTFTTTSAPDGLLVSGTGAVSTTGTLAADTYSVSGTDKDSNSDTGTWAFSVTVSPVTITQGPPTSDTTTTTSSVNYTNLLTTTGGIGSVTFDTTSGAGDGLVVSGSGAVSTSGALGSDTYSISGTDHDAHGDTGTWSFNLNVTGITLTQGAPTSSAVTEGTGYSGNLTVTDTPEGDDVTWFEDDSADAAFIVVDSSGDVDAPGSLSVGTYTVTGEDQDSYGDTGTWTFTLDVNAPSITLTQGAPTSATVSAGTGYTGQLAVTDAPSETTVTWSETASADSTDVVVDPSGAVSASASLSPATYTVSGTDEDSDGDTGTWGFTLTVGSVSTGTAPVFVTDNPPLSFTSGILYHYGFLATGTPTPTYALAGAPSWLSVDQTTGVVEGTPPAGISSFDYQVLAENSVGTATTPTFSVRVFVLPTPPVTPAPPTQTPTVPTTSPSTPSPPQQSPTPSSPPSSPAPGPTSTTPPPSTVAPAPNPTPSPTPPPSGPARAPAPVPTVVASIPAVLQFAPSAVPTVVNPNPTTTTKPPVITLSTSTLVPGESTTVRGEGCAAGSTVQLVLDGHPVGSTTATAAGRFTATVVPQSADIGPHTLTATCGSTREAVVVTMVALSKLSTPESGAAIFCVFILLGLILLRGQYYTNGTRRRRKRTAAEMLDDVAD
ncbi:MAG TPA: putative Ig domain-containing protein [Acidimicrobiales bacterium]|nr:putative Ig domain-containing protein [Acidimicrobiales bacterium]